MSPSIDPSTFIVQAFKAAEANAKAGAPINPAIAAAQAALESAYGKSYLARAANNLFGIKAGRKWLGRKISLPTREFDPDRGLISITADFRAYDDWQACFADYAKIIGSLSWYRDAVAAKDDPIGFIRGLIQRPGEPGWATDPKYLEKVLRICRQWHLIEH
jgi:flagellar protein FlgJ